MLPEVAAWADSLPVGILDLEPWLTSAIPAPFDSAAWAEGFDRHCHRDDKMSTGEQISLLSTEQSHHLSAALPAPGGYRATALTSGITLRD